MTFCHPDIRLPRQRQHRHPALTPLADGGDPLPRSGWAANCRCVRPFPQMGSVGDQGVTAHEPVRPKWICNACGFPWPCAATQAELSEDFARFPTSFAAYLAHFYALAFGDFATQLDGAPPDLRDRFLGWLPRPRVDGAGIRPDRAATPPADDVDRLQCL